MPIESNNLMQKSIGAFFDVIVYLDRSLSHVYSGISFAFWHKSDLRQYCSIVTIFDSTLLREIKNEQKRDKRSINSNHSQLINLVAQQRSEKKETRELMMQ